MRLALDSCANRAAMPMSITKLCDDIRGYANLPPNWDTYGAGPVPQNVIDFCVLFLNELDKSQGMLLPRALPTCAGAMLFWGDQGHEMYGDIDDTGSFWVYREGSEQTDVLEDEDFDASKCVEFVVRHLKDIS